MQHNCMKTQCYDSLTGKGGCCEALITRKPPLYCGIRQSEVKCTL